VVSLKEEEVQKILKMEKELDCYENYDTFRYTENN
jgi:hypothetical protein